MSTTIYFPAASTRLPHGFLERNGRKLQHQRKTVGSTSLHTTKHEFYTYQQQEGVLSTEAQSQCSYVLTSSSDFLMELLIWYFSDRGAHVHRCSVFVGSGVRTDQSERSAYSWGGASSSPECHFTRIKKKLQSIVQGQQRYESMYINVYLLFLCSSIRTEYKDPLTFKHQRANTGLLHMIPWKAIFSGAIQPARSPGVGEARQGCVKFQLHPEQLLWSESMVFFGHK